MRIKKVVACIQKLYFRFYDDEVAALGAQLAYYLVLSFFPFLIFLMTLVAYSPVSRDEILRLLSQVLPYTSYSLIRDNISVIRSPVQGRLLPIGIITTLWAASNGMGAVIRGLNKAYDTEEVRPFWKLKVQAILFTIGLAMIIIFSFILLIFGQHIGIYLAELLGLSQLFYKIWDIFRYAIMLIFTAIIFAVLYYYAPSPKLKLREVLPGAIFATFGWVIASLGFAYYANNFVNYSIVYGSIGGVIVLLIWLFISTMIIIMGGELNATFAFEKEGKEKPKGKRY